MAAYTFKDVTDLALKEINLVPGYDARKTGKKLGDDRVFRVFHRLIKHPELADLNEAIEKKRSAKQDFGAEAAEAIKKAKEKNLPWLNVWGCENFKDYYYATAKPTEDKFTEKIIIEKKDIEPKTRDYVLEVNAPTKPKLYALSVPESYFLPEKKLNRLFMHYHFRPGPWQAADHAYEVDAALKPVDSSLQGLVPGRSFYPYGWDYLFFNLWTYLYSLRNKPNDRFNPGLAYQGLLSEKDVITILPMTDIGLKGEEILEAEKFEKITEGIARFLEKEIQKANPGFKLRQGPTADAAYLANDSTIAYPYRVSLSCNSNGMVLMLALMIGLKKLKFVRELYLFDPTQLEGVHNAWVGAALAWAGKDPERYVRVYSQPFEAFNKRNQVIGRPEGSKIQPNTLAHFQASKHEKRASLETLSLHGQRSLAEFNLDLLKTQPDFDADFIRSFENTAKDPFNKWRALHSMIPGLMYTDALVRSGFRSQQEVVATGSSLAAEKKLLSDPSAPGTGSLAKPIKEVFWSDSSNRRLTSGYLKYGETLRLNLDMAAGAAKLFVEVDASKFSDDVRFNVALLQTLNAVPGGKPHTLDIDTHANNSIFGDTILKGKIVDAQNNLLAEIPPLRMDIVPYLPKMLSDKGWQVAKQCMERWFSFTADFSKDKSKTAVTDNLKIVWATSFAYVKEKILDTFNNGSLTSTKAKQEIATVVKDLVNAAKLSLPANVGDEVTLKHQVSTLRSNAKGEQSPEFHLFHFWSVSLSPVFPFPRVLDDFIAAVNACNINFLPFGKIRKVSNHAYSIHLDSVGVYLMDWYDFEGNQDLGSWNVKTGDVGLFNFTQKPNTNEVKNAMFRDWRNRNKKGQDYTNFSDIGILPLNLHFLMSDAFSVI